MSTLHTLTRAALVATLAAAGLAQAAPLSAEAPSTAAVMSAQSASVALRHGHGRVMVRGGWGPRVVVSPSPWWWWTPAVTVPVVVAGAVVAAEAAQAAPVVVAPPPPVAPVTAAATRPEPIIYPRNGQSPAQLEADRQECNKWAATQNGALADSTIFARAVDACMDGRGYTTK